MIAYTTVGTNDLERAGAFYDDVFAGLGAKRAMEAERYIAWSTGDGPMFLAITPFNKEDPQPGNGPMVAIHGRDPETIQAIYNRAIELGATDEGPPGARTEHFYGAYFRDLDGNKVAVVHFG